MGEVERLKELLAKATQGEWHWVIHDCSMATLGVGDDPGMGDPHVMSIGPCPSCADRAHKNGEEWRWGRCQSPSEADAAFMAETHNALPTLLSQLEEMRERERKLVATLNSVAKQAQIALGGTHGHVGALESIQMNVRDVLSDRALLSQTDEGERMEGAGE